MNDGISSEPNLDTTTTTLPSVLSDPSAMDVSTWILSCILLAAWLVCATITVVKLFRTKDKSLVHKLLRVGLLSIVFALVWLWIFTGGLSNFIFGEWADSSPDPITFGNILKSLCLLLIINIIPLIIMAISIKTLWKLGRDNGDTTAVDKADKRGDEQRETQREPFDTKEDL